VGSHRVAILDEDIQARHVERFYQESGKYDGVAFHVPNRGGPPLQRMDDLPTNAEDALGQLSDYDVVVTDQNHTEPHWSGEELLEEAADGDYGVDVILYTGDLGFGENGLDIERAEELSDENKNVEYVPKHSFEEAGAEELVLEIDKSLPACDQADQHPVL